MGLAGVGPGLGLDTGQLYFFDSFFCSFEFWEKKGDTKRGEKFFPFLLASLLLSDFFLLLSQLSFSLSLSNSPMGWFQHASTPPTIPAPTSCGFVSFALGSL